MSSFLSPSPPDLDPDEPGESFESVPWESLRFDSSGPDRRRWYVIAGVIAGVAIAFSALIRLTPGEPTPVVVPSSVTTIPTAMPTTTTMPQLITEADLMALDPMRVERVVMAFAETAVAEYFAADAGGVWSGVEFGTVRSTYTERVTAVEVTDLGGGTYRVLVAASVLDAGEDGMFERRPVRGVTVDIDTGAERLTVLGLPTPADLPFGHFERGSGPEEDPSAQLLESVGRWQPAFGQIEGDSARIVTDRSGNLRADVVVVDTAGNRWPVSIPLTSEGALETFDTQP